jgi:hypothetical protein
MVHSKKYGDKKVILDADVYKYIVDNDIVLTLHGAKKYPTPYAKFNIIKNGYRTTMLVHRFITKCPDDKIVDHINHNPLDNRLANLRICRPFDNSNNKIIPTTGVNKHCSGKWRATITIDNKQISLGYYDNYNDAVDRRLQAELDYYGGQQW